MELTLVSWNVAGRTGLLDAQAGALERRAPDLVALQEVRPSTAPRWREHLAGAGLPYTLDSGEFRNGRRIFNLLASRWELTELFAVGGPQPERVLSAVSESPAGQVEIHVAHIPPARGNGLMKVETCEALFTRLATPCDRHRVLCGDLNTPRLESTDGEVETFASNHPDREARWDAAERSLLTGLADWDLHDAFRERNGYERHCDYMHEWREAGLSDHSPIETVFRPRAS